MGRRLWCRGAGSHIRLRWIAEGTSGKSVAAWFGFDTRILLGGVMALRIGCGGVIIVVGEGISGIRGNVDDNTMVPCPYRGLPYRCILSSGHPMNRSILHIVAVGISTVLAAQADQKVTQPTPLYELQIRGIGG